MGEDNLAGLQATPDLQRYDSRLVVEQCAGTLLEGETAWQFDEVARIGDQALGCGASATCHASHPVARLEVGAGRRLYHLARKFLADDVRRFDLVLILAATAQQV